MRKRGLCCRPVSVGLFVTLVDCIQTAKDIVKFLSRPGRPVILVFLTPSASTKFQGNPFSMQGRKMHGKGKVCHTPTGYRRAAHLPF